MPKPLIAIIFLCGLALGVSVGWLIWGRAEPKAKPGGVDLSVVDGGIYRVRTVVDGDTIALENGVHIRYNGVNAPEMGHFVKDRAPLAEEATARNVQLVEGKNVRVKLSRDPLDMYGRVCARVFVIEGDPAHPTRETEIGAVLLKEGLAKLMALGTTPEETRDLKKLEEEAKQAKVGMWGLEEKLRKEGSAKPYCAAEKSAIYHLIACPTAKRISPQNLHLYASSDDAEAAGLKPCNKCVPK